MQIIQDTTEFRLPEGARTAIAIGKFDGIHLGHQKLLQCLLERQELTPAVFTFDPSPESFFAGRPLPQLLTREEKRHRFAQMGIGILIEFPMNAETAATPPERFVSEYLADRLHAGLIAAGNDLSFGDRGRGDIRLLMSMGEEFHYETRCIDKVIKRGEEVSSTRIRRALQEGRIEEAGELLGSPYSVTGQVIHGRHLGTQLGFPTLNLTPTGEKLLPPYGVYRSRVTISGRKECLRGLTNIGTKPTVQSTVCPSLETYLYDFDGDLYGSTIMVELLSFVRPERRFADVTALKAQIAADITAGSE
ncbi:MAG: riboflavin biosynthesis protein RibF [Butyrivibrio sp.]|nr:riboflavin biosynthesis protein RibF [Butyrivibrio sp.]